MNSEKRCPKSSGYNFVAEQKTKPSMKKVIRIQDTFRPELPQVVGCRDYREQEELLLKADRILTESGVEQLFTRLSLEH